MLQRSFSYLGASADAPVDSIQIRTRLPVFDFVIRDDRVERRPVGEEPVEIDQRLDAEQYAIAASASGLVGAPSDARRLFVRFFRAAFAEGRLASLAFEIPVDLGLDGTVVGTTTLRALPLVVGGTPADGARSWASLALERATDADPGPELDRHVVLVNAERHDELARVLSDMTGRDEQLLALVVMRYLDAAGIGPEAVFDDPTPERRDVLRRSLVSLGLDPDAELVDWVNRVLPVLFDFPLELGALAPLTIAGTFELRSNAAEALTKKDLAFYELVAEYQPSDGPHAVTLRYDWAASVNRLEHGKVPFDFAEARKIVVGGRPAVVVVTVKSFDGVVQWTATHPAGADELAELEIVVDRVTPVRLDPGGGPTSVGKRLRGRVVELVRDCPVKDVTVVVQAKEADDGMWMIVGAASTDSSGNFWMPYPSGDYVRAQALTSLSPDHPADIVVRAERSPDTISDDFLYLLVTDPTCPHADGEDCDCYGANGAGRLPDQADLVGSGDYTQDLGSGCVNLSVPNRTLAEYSYRGIVRTSDPDVANYTLVKDPDAGTFELQGGAVTQARNSVSLANPIRWQDAPGAHENLSLYQAVTVATGHLLHYKAVFKADGYSLGDLLYSLALAPGQKREIVQIDARHRLQASESQSISQSESLSASLVNERNVLDQVSGNLAEALRGHSDSSTAGVSAGLGVGVSYAGIGAALGVSGGYSNSESNASQNSSRNTAMFFGEQLRQGIMQNAHSYRQLNATVITTVREGQTYDLTTDVIANHNHCHALTMMYFEVLRHFAIFQELESVEECIFVPLLMTEFSASNIYKWSDVLADHLLPLPANTYLQPIPFLRYRAKHPLIPAFDANARIQSSYKFVDFPSGAYCDDPITSVTGHLNLRVNVPRPKTVYDRVKSFPVVKREVLVNHHGGGLFGFLADTFLGPDISKHSWEEREKFIDSHIRIYDNFQTGRPEDVIEVIDFKDFFAPGSRDDRLWRAVADLLGYSDVEAFLQNYFAHKTISQWDETFNDEIAPRIFEALTKNTITLTPFTGLDTTPAGKYRGGERLIRMNFGAHTSKTRRQISDVRIGYSKTISYANDFWDHATLNIEGLSIHYTTNHYDGYIVNTTVNTDLHDNNVTPYVVNAPMNSSEQRDPHDEDQYLVRKLIEHLNSNIEYYNKVLWTRLDPDRRYMLLDGFNIGVYNDFGVPQPPRSLASVVKNQLLGISGNSIIFPVAAGYRVSQSYLSEVDEKGENERVSLLDHYRPDEPVPPYRISVPSEGVFLEAVQGACDACERVKENSSQDWERFRTDEPTAILPVNTPTPTVTDWRAAFEEFASPLVNIQNAPALPAPGEGLAGITELLGKPGVFNDITGLSGTQQNAMRTYLSNQENAKAFAEMAKGMAMQSHNTEHSDKIMETLDSAKAKGALNDEEYGKLVKAHAQQQIDGGAATKADADREERKATPSPIKSAVQLSQEGAGSVKATESDADGNVKSLEVAKEGGGSAKYDVSIPGTLEPMRQDTPMACWATVATMMANWKNQAGQSVHEYVASVGAQWLPYIDAGLPLTKVTEFAGAAGMQYDAPNAQFPVSHYVDVLGRFGPIWVTDLESTDVTLLHGRLVTGVHGDDSSASTTFRIVDPMTGTTFDEDLPTFMAKTERVVQTITAFKDATVPLLIYFNDAYDPAAFGGSGTGKVTVGGVPDNQNRIRDFVPTAPDTLVVDGIEKGAVAGLTNWRGMYEKADGTFDEAARDADRFFADPLHPGTRVYSGGGYRPASALNKIALHETAGSRDLLMVSDFRVATWRDSSGAQHSYRPMAHFCINRDGTIRQFLDVCELANHLPTLNATSIGIEFVNDPWGTAGQADQMKQDGAKHNGVSATKVPAIRNLPSLDKQGKELCVYLPPKAQLDALVTLVNALIAVDVLEPQIEHTWLNLININPKKIATEKLDDLHAYWILNNAGTKLDDVTLSGINGNVSNSGWSRSAPGIYTHLLLGGHSDGLVQGLYTWLRIDQNMSANNALTTLTDALSDKALRIDAGGGLVLMDITKIVYQVA